mgnify:CR=1 FL=1
MYFSSRDLFVYFSIFTFLLNKNSLLILALNQTELHFFSYEDLEPKKSDFMIYLRVNAEIELFYNTIIEKGIAIHPNGTLDKKPWNQIEFSIIDPNGTLLTFGQFI